MTQQQMTSIDDFRAMYADAKWLEDDSNGNERWSNGLGEGSTHESEWFAGDTGEHLPGHSRDEA